ncbi:hypothetical protein [Desulfolithobacter sp.]
MNYQTCDLTEKALEKAAKLICTLKCGLCPIREPDFSGCPFTCTEDIRPWQCWVRHLKGHCKVPHPPGEIRPDDRSRPTTMVK